MSRVAKKPILIPQGVKVVLAKEAITVEGKKGTLRSSIPANIDISQSDGLLKFAPKKVAGSNKGAGNLNWALAGTQRALVNNMVLGVSEGYQRKLQLVGVGYKARVQNKVLELSLGLSHLVNYNIPQGVSIETPSQTEIVISGIDKQLIGQVAANIRNYRKPEPYKGKGVRYSNEIIILKEVKKK